MKKIILLLSFGFLVSCSSNGGNDIERKKSIFVVGNSITYSPQGGEWQGNWGMAATAPDKDFCGILSKYYNLDRKNIAVWENDFYCDEEHWKIVTDKHYDYIIIKIGENVSEINNFKSELQKLTDFYRNYGDKIILVTTVWKQYSFDNQGNPYEVSSDKDRIIKEIANENNYTLVDIYEMTNYPNYYAWNMYADSAIGSHPNDLGMEYIATKIIEEL